MKKVISIAFVAILLLNVLGYYGVFIGLQYSHDLTMARTLDDDSYSASETITIRVPVSLPYATDQTDFQRVDGKFTHEGKVYRLVKQRYAKDTLTVICLNDTQGTKINKALSSYVKTFTDRTEDQAPNSGSKTTFSFIKDYIPENFSVSSLAFGWAADVVQNSFERSFISSFEASIIHPPERA